MNELTGEDLQLKIVMKEIQRFFSYGKLLLSGEYVVLFGAKGLALPTRFGQSLTVYENASDRNLTWIAREKKETWFSARYALEDFTIIETSDEVIGKKLQKILRVVRKLNHLFLQTPVCVVTDLDFNRNWGLGTSSTLLTNIANWATIDPFELHWNVSGGSGYDIACAIYGTALVYQCCNKKPVITPVQFSPKFQENLYFVYLGNKQDSAKSIEKLNELEVSQSQLNQISEITTLMQQTEDLNEFIKLLICHEQIIAEITGQTIVKEKLFKDFKGAIKSLGAWGGDFILAATFDTYNEVQDYFKKLGFTTIFTYSALVKN